MARRYPFGPPFAFLGVPPMHVGEMAREWVNVEDKFTRTIHILPTDETEHQASAGFAPNCWCAPRLAQEGQALLVIHMSAAETHRPPVSN